MKTFKLTTEFIGCPQINAIGIRTALLLALFYFATGCGTYTNRSSSCTNGVCTTTLTECIEGACKVTECKGGRCFTTYDDSYRLKMANQGEAVQLKPGRDADPGLKDEIEEFLQQLPTDEEVYERIAGSNANVEKMDPVTAARVQAAFYTLAKHQHDLLWALPDNPAPDGSPLTFYKGPRDARTARDYSNLNRKRYMKSKNGFSPSQATQWYNLQKQYNNSSQTMEALWRQVVPPDLRKRYEELLQRKRKNVDLPRFHAYCDQRLNYNRCQDFLKSRIQIFGIRSSEGQLYSQLLTGLSAAATGFSPNANQKKIIALVQREEQFLKSISSSDTSVMADQKRVNFNRSMLQQVVYLQNLCVFDVKDTGLDHQALLYMPLVDSRGPCPQLQAYLGGQPNPFPLVLEGDYHSPVIILSGLSKQRALAYQKGQRVNVQGKLVGFTLYHPTPDLEIPGLLRYFAGFSQLELR